jgi:3,4-dihydroxy 2-butanone 4-phosphate synthase/GTP cyclohydrolase II
MTASTGIAPEADTAGAAIAALAAGRPVVVSGAREHQGGGDLVFAASLATTEVLAFTVRHTSGFVCVAMPESSCDRLDLPPMHPAPDRFGTSHRTTVDLRGTGTGISATSRARTIAALGSPDSRPADFTRPGHVLPLAVDSSGSLRRAGRPEAAAELARLAGLPEVAGLCAIVSPGRPTRMATGAERTQFADEHNLAHVTVDDLVRTRLRIDPPLHRGPAEPVTTPFGVFHAISYSRDDNGPGHVALVAGDLDRVTPATPVHVHEECLTADVFGAQRCGCAQSLHTALRQYSAAGSGIVIYLRGGRSPANGCPSSDTSKPTGTPQPAQAQWIARDLGASVTSAPHSTPRLT